VGLSRHRTYHFLYYIISISRPQIRYYIISYIVVEKVILINIRSFSQMLNGNLIYFFDNNTKKKYSKKK
jgi:hypothetical protein